MKKTIKRILKAFGLYFILQQAKATRKASQHRKQYEPYKGSGFECNFCGAKYEKFVPRVPSTADIGALTRHQVVYGGSENVFCPNCQSKARDRLVKYALDTYENINDKQVLHLSPEPVLYEYIKNKSKVITADLDPEIYQTIDKKVRKEDATSFSFSDNQFDIVIANHILEHIPDDRKAMLEIFRILKPDGRAVLQVPFSNTIDNTLEEPSIQDPERQSALFGQKDHVRIYKLTDFLDRLREAGFIVNYISPEQIPVTNKFALQSEEGFIDCRKPAG